jgi:hypothetical protein
VVLAQRVLRFLFAHPLAKATGLGLFGILGNVLAGAYVFDIIRLMDNVAFLDWRGSPRSRYFWALIAVLLIMGLYGWGMARFETRVRKALTEADVLEIALQELLGPLIEVAKRDIKEGKLRSLEDVKKMFGSAKGNRG